MSIILDILGTENLYLVLN